MLESLKEYQVPKDELEKYVTLRLVNWMSGSHMYAQSERLGELFRLSDRCLNRSNRPSVLDEPEDDMIKRLKAQLLPTLTAIARSQVCTDSSRPAH